MNLSLHSYGTHDTDNTYCILLDILSVPIALQTFFICAVNAKTSADELKRSQYAGIKEEALKFNSEVCTRPGL